MITAAYYLVIGSAFLFVGLSGRGIREDVDPEKAKKAKKLLSICGGLLLVGALWELLARVL